MLRLALEFIIVAAILLVVTIPVSIVSKERRRHRAPRNWRIGACVVAACSALLGWSSRDLIGKCEAARNNACFDIGSSGMRMLLLGGFVSWALLSAYLLYND